MRARVSTAVTAAMHSTGKYTRIRHYGRLISNLGPMHHAMPAAVSLPGPVHGLPTPATFVDPRALLVSPVHIQPMSMPPVMLHGPFSDPHTGTPDIVHDTSSYLQVVPSSLGYSHVSVGAMPISMFPYAAAGTATGSTAVLVSGSAAWSSSVHSQYPPRPLGPFLGYPPAVAAAAAFQVPSLAYPPSEIYPSADIIFSAPVAFMPNGYETVTTSSSIPMLPSSSLDVKKESRR